MLISIGGAAIPAPDTYEVVISDLDASANRSGNGTLFRDRIAVKRSIHLGWTFLSAQDISQLLTAVSPVFFNVTYLDPQLNTLNTGTFYVSDRNQGVALKLSDGTYRWANVSFTLVER
jgi:hypothetical protein